MMAPAAAGPPLAKAAPVRDGSAGSTSWRNRKTSSVSFPAA
jgi:hypothetical protein